MFRLPDPRIAALAAAASVALALPAAADAAMVFPDGDVAREARGDSATAVTWRTPTVDFGRLRGEPNCNPDSGSAFPIGTTTVDCLASIEVCPGPPFELCTIQLARGSFTVTVTPGAGPLLSGLSDRSIAADAGRDTARVDYALPAASDPSGVALGSLACAPAPGSEFALGDTTVICGARDTVGNESSATFRVSVFRAPAAPSAATPDSPAGPAASGPGDAGAAVQPAARAVAIGRRLRISRGVARLAVSCPKGNPVACTGTVKLENARKRRLGRARLGLRPGGKATVRIRLSRPARLALARGRLRVKAIATTSDPAGRPLTGARTFRIGAPRR